MALLTYGFGHIPDTANVTVSINQGGQVEVTMGMADLGGGQPTTMSMLVAEVLGASLSDVSISLGDTQYPAAPLQGTFGSRTTFIAGNAAVSAAANAKQKLLAMASKVLNADVSSLYTSGSRVLVTGSGRARVSQRYWAASRTEAASEAQASTSTASRRASRVFSSALASRR